MKEKENIIPQNIYQDEDIYVNLSDKELKDLYEDLEADYWVSIMKEEQKLKYMNVAQIY